MPSTRPTVDPVLDVLEEMGYDFDELDGDGYKRSIQEAMFRTHPDTGGKSADTEKFSILNEEFKKIRRPKAVEKETTVKGKNVNKAKLLPGTTFRPQDIKPDNEAEIGDDEDKKKDVISFLNGDVKDKLEEINQSVIEIKDVVVTQGDLADDRDEELRKSILAAKKKKREDKLEKKKTVKDKMLESVTKPVGNFLNKLIKFVMMTFVGSVVNRVLSLLKDPAQFLDPIKQFFNFIIGLVNAVMKGLWMITGAPMNFIIGGINNGVKSLLDALNKATALLKIPAIDSPEIPMIPGPPEFQFIPLSKTAQEKNAAVGMSEGGEVPAMDGMSGMDGMDGMSGVDGADGLEGLPGLGGGGGGTDAITAKATTKSLGTRTKDIGNLFARPFRDKSEVVDPRSQFATGFSGGGYAAPYPEGDSILGLSPSFSGLIGYNKGGQVPGSGNKDTVPAMLTPGEFVMSKGAVNQIGVDNLKEMNAAGGGTNQPKLMKFAGGGSVPEIGTPPSKGRNVVVIGGGKQSSPNVSSSGSGTNNTPVFSSVDPNNVNIPVIKSIYNIMS